MISSTASAPDRSPAHNGPTLVLPFSRRPDPKTPFQPASVPVDLAFNQELQASSEPLRILLAAWAILLWRFADQTEVPIEYIGQDISKALSIVAHLSDAILFQDVVEQLGAAVKAAIPADGRVRGTDCHAMFCVADDPFSGESMVKGERFLIMLSVRKDPARWKADLFYDSSVLPTHAVRRLARGLEVLLAAAILNPSQLACALPILDDQDRRQVTVAFNQTEAPYPSGKCIHELFEQQVETWPDRVALRDQEQTFTYRQLDDRANRIAHFLRRKGAVPNMPVALYMNRCAEMIVGLLAILKSGACYLPLIPTDPQARIAGQIAHTGPPILLTVRKLAQSLPAYAGEVVLIDDSFANEPINKPESTTTPDDLVYVLFTSGSTGTPKGVATHHRNLVNYTHFICRQLQLEKHPEGWNFATVSTLAADLGNTSVFGALTSGGSLHVIDYETAMSASAFANYVAAHPIDVLKIAPSHLATLLRECGSQSVLPREIVIVGGERLTWDLLRDIRARSGCAVMNHCGPTETTIGCCTLIVNEESFSRWNPATIPLGKPIANDRIYILDRRMQAVPIGVAGELYMSGAGLSRGYFKQPELTAERFLVNPFPDGYDRIYRTGDLGRFLPDGTIEFLGRIDHQVKIRGFRVEPAELEAALRRHAGVTQAVATCEEGPQGERSLVAYVACSDKVSRDELRSFLASQLPDYMLPARVIFLDHLPLNANGKIDLQALPQLSKRSDDDGAFVVPATSDEEKLAAIWCEVLGLDRVSRDDNFFSLGGHSLLATQIVSRIRRVFRVNFPLYALLETPTLQGSAARLSEFERLTSSDEEVLAHLLSEINEISEKEAEQVLAAGKDPQFGSRF